MARLIVAGDRRFGRTPKRPKPTPEHAAIFKEARQFFIREVIDLRSQWKDTYWNPHEFISGCADGIDDICIELAPSLTGKQARKFPANWFEHGKKAGSIRNMEMAKNGDGAIILAAPDSKGSFNMVRCCKEVGIPYILKVYEWDLLDLFIPGFHDLCLAYKPEKSEV